VIEFSLEESEFRQAGIELVEPPTVYAFELLRLLVSRYREPFLATEDELRQRIPRDLPLILQLDEWHHPDLAADELPSTSETFQVIADVLVTGDSTRYMPTKTPNTHWSNWPEGGTL
jgi:hypothetical protein